MEHLNIEFDHWLLRNKPKVLASLSKLYCEIWMYDKNFQEYRQCPICKAYFGEFEVETQKVGACDGAKANKSHQLVELVPAWNPVEVANDILSDSQLPGFKGFVTVLPNGTIVAFTWGKVMPLSKVRQTWGEDLVQQLTQINPNPDVCYYDELGRDRSYRGFGFGEELARMLTKWMRKDHPEKLALLRTHKDAGARGIYEKLGYKLFAHDTEHGQGRIMMKVDRCADLLTD